MYWVIQNNLYSEEGFERLLTTLERFGLPHSVHKVIPFIHELDPEVNPPPGPVIVMGSYTMAHYARRRRWLPGAFFGDNFDFEVQHRHWGAQMLNADARAYRLAEVPEQREPFFIRPIVDSKSFGGTVMDWPHFETWRDGWLTMQPEEHPHVTADTRVLVCTKKPIWSETRTWIVDGKVVTASGYKVGTLKRYTERVDERITEFATRCANVWVPDRAFVLDVADTPDGLKIVEVNNLNAAGFYCADMGKLVTALEDLSGFYI